MQEVFHLADGRKIACREYGDKHGFPVIGLHGTPGSRIWFTADDSVSTDLGVRLITIDRPGYGLSTQKPKRKILDFNEDIKSVLNALKIDQFSILGVSGGGAYALAYATCQDPALYKTGLVASIYEFGNGKIPTGMNIPNRTGFFLARRLPWLLRWSYSQQKKLLDKNPQKYVSSIQKNLGHLCESDQAISKRKDVADANVLHLKEAFSMNAHEVVNELKLFTRNWGFDLKGIASKVEVWHGEDDTLSPITGLQKYITEIPDYEAHFLKGKGHFLDEEEDIWRKILESLTP